MSHIIKNDKGEIINGIKELQEEGFGTGKYRNGEPEVNWNLLRVSGCADDDGFDIRNKEENGYYKIKVTLPQNTIIIRYGRETGFYTAPKGTDYSELSLPYKRETIAYNEYKVVSDKVTVCCIVEKGKVAPGFGNKGGGMQFKHNETIGELIKGKALLRIQI